MQPTSTPLPAHHTMPCPSQSLLSTNPTTPLTTINTLFYPSTPIHQPNLFKPTLYPLSTATHPAPSHFASHYLALYDPTLPLSVPLLHTQPIHNLNPPTHASPHPTSTLSSTVIHHVTILFRLLIYISRIRTLFSARH